MDDDPESGLDQMILGNREASESLLRFGEQKCGAETGKEGAPETIQQQESGDIGPAVDPESPKKSTAGKDSPNQPLQTESQTTLFRRKDWRDQGQQADLSGCVKSSSTSLRKPARWSNQRLAGQESHRNSQQAGAQQPLLSEKPPRLQAANEVDVKDPSWVSQRTGKIMKCRSQQTSSIWERKTLSEILRPYSEESTPSKDEDSEFTSTEKDSSSSGETANKRYPKQGSRCGTEQLEGKVPKHGSQQHLEKFRSRRSNQRSTEQSPTLSPKYSRVSPAKGMGAEEDITWISQKTGREMKCKAQQTSLLWEPKANSDVLRVYSKGSVRTGDEDSGEDEEKVAKMEQATMKDSQHSIQHLEVEKSGPEVPQAEERKPPHQRKKHKSKIDQALQTDSVESIKKVLADSSQQTDVSPSTKTSLVDQSQDPGCGAEQTDVQGSRRSSQELVGQDFGRSSPQPELQGSRRSSQLSLRTETKEAEVEESSVPSDIESEPSQLDRKASCIEEVEEDIWISQKTGRVVRNQNQQTDQSWLLYLALVSQKIKRCISQQTDNSFLQQYKPGILKKAVEEHRKFHTEPRMQLCAQCGDLYGEDFTFDLDALSSFSTMSVLSGICNLTPAGAEDEGDQEPSASEGEEEQPETQQPPEQASRRGSQLASGEQSPKESRGSLKSVDHQPPPARASESESNTASECSSLYAEGEDKIQQTYSLISFEDGIWLSRKTGKLLVSHTQQTSETLVPTVSRTSLEKSKSPAEEIQAPPGMDDTSVGLNQYFQQEMEVDRQQTSDKGTQKDSQPDQNGRTHLILVRPTGEEFQTSDEVEKLVCSRLSEATLLSLDSPDVEDGPVQMYAVISLEKGVWLNVKTGRLLASQGQQTEVSPEQNSTEDK